MYFDGSKTSAGAGIGILLITPEKEMIPYSLKLAFSCTHNMAEYEALIQGLKLLLEFKVRRVQVQGDSLLVISQINGEWQIKEPKLIPYHEMATSLIKQFEECRLTHVKREQNPIADGLASLGTAITFKTGESFRSFEIGQLQQPAYAIPEQILQAEVGEPPWYHKIMDYLQQGTFPPDMTRKERQAIKHMSARYFILAGVLYRRGFSTEYARCLDKDEAFEVVKEAH